MRVLKLYITAIIVHFDLSNTKRGLTLKVHALFIWKVIQYIGVIESGAKFWIPPTYVAFGWSFDHCKCATSAL